MTEHIGVNWGTERGKERKRTFNEKGEEKIWMEAYTRVIHKSFINSYNDII